MERLITCIWEGCENAVENQDTGECASHGALSRKMERQAAKAPKQFYSIPRVSQKQAKEVSAYSREKQKWIAIPENQMCAVFPKLKAVDVHHKKGKVGYADEWARRKGIKLLHDKRFWLPVSREGHIEIENNHQWATDMGFKLSRLEILDEDKPTI